MRALIVLAAVLGACDPEVKDTDTGEVWVAPAAAPWVSLAGATVSGAFKSTCTMSMDVVDKADGALLATVPLAPADGGRWAGMELPEGKQVTGTLSWNDCENTADGTGSFESSTFSGNAGDLFVLHYDGVDAGFEYMVQATDHLGGEVHAQFDPDAIPSEVDGLIEGLGLTQRTDEADATFRYLSWTDATSVADVLASLSQDERFVWGEPTWVAKPAWW